MSKLHKYIDLSKLPRKEGIGANHKKQVINWDNSIGYNVYFEYGDKCGELKIVSRDKLKLKVLYDGNTYDISTSSLSTCNLGKILKMYTSQYKLDIGEIIKDDRRNLIILDREKRSRKDNKGYNIFEKWYYFKCGDCKYQDWKVESSLLSQKAGCPACCTPPQVLAEGINDITTTAPWMVKYFQGGYDEAKQYHKYSKEKIDAICPDCGNVVKQKMIRNICAAKGLSCACGDGWSYPNKFIYNLLEQLNVDFQPEKIFKWSDNRSYDDYVKHNGLEIIIENHGLQHYKKSNLSRKRTITQEKQNDIYKEKLAKSNGIKHYIVLDCRYSEKEWLLNSVMSSDLPKLLNFKKDDIDWNECDKFALSNLLKKVCERRKENPNLTTNDLASEFKTTRGTIIRYLNKGTQYGWCYYNSKEEISKIKSRPTRDNGGKPIKWVDGNMVFICTSAFVYWYDKKYGKKLQARNIRSVCAGKRGHVNNFTFQYISKEEFNKVKHESPELAYGDFFDLENQPITNK